MKNITAHDLITAGTGVILPAAYIIGMSIATAMAIQCEHAGATIACAALLIAGFALIPDYQRRISKKIA